jgi:hypothetical protein
MKGDTLFVVSEGEKGRTKGYFVSFFTVFFSVVVVVVVIAFLLESIILLESIGGGGGGGGGVAGAVVVVVDVESIVELSDFFEHEDIPPTNATNAPSTMSLRSLMAIYLLV